jgi:hypothetical protein
MRIYLKVVAMLCAALHVFAATPAAACMKAYGRTAQEALQAGFELTERHDEVTKKNGELAPYVRVSILPDKENGLFVAEVHSSAFCIMSFNQDEGMDDIMPELPGCTPRKSDTRSVRAAASVAAREEKT